jgi:hypothetical protein
MNWFKRIFCGQEEFGGYVDQWGLPSVKNLVPIPKVKPPKPDKDISEPVLSFVKCVQENPKRFKVTYDFEYYGCEVNNGVVGISKKPTTYNYSLVDVMTGESWSLTKEMLFTSCRQERKHTYNPEWLTADETEYLIDSVKTIFQSRKDRKAKLQQIRKERRIRDERNRLKEIYK